MIDTHAHLYSEPFAADRDEVIKRAIESNVTLLVIPSTDSDNYDSMMSLCRAYPDVCLPAVGLHPTSVGENYAAELAFVEKQLAGNKFVALGEIGIDCYWSLDYIEQQREAFEKQVKLADQYDLPIIIHARNAFAEIFPILDRVATSKTKGIFHSFSGSRDDYFKIREYGSFKIGIGGTVTFKNSSLPQVLEAIPLTDIVLETDAPYLAPHPHRGKRNESAFIPLIAQKIAEIKNLSVETVDTTTTETAKKLLGIV